MSLITALSQLFSKSESKHLSGVSIGQTAISLCVMPDKADSEKVNFLNKPLSVNLSQNGQPDVAINAVADTLNHLITSQEITGQCQVIIPSSHYQIVQIDKPNVPDAEIVAALKWQVKDLVSINVDDMIVDYFDGPTLAGGATKLNVVCASKSFQASLVNTAAKNDLQITMISTEEFAFASLITVQDEAVLLVCQQPNEEIVLMIVKQGKLYFHRRLRGFAQIAQQSEQQLALGTVDSLSLEIQRSTDYFERQLKQSPIKDIQVIVPMDNELLLVEKLAANTHIPVHLMSLPVENAQQRQYAAAFGATQLSRMEKCYDE